MKDTMIMALIKKTNLRYLIFNSLLVLATSFVLVNNLHHFYNIFFGPFDVGGRSLKEPSLVYMSEKNQIYFVEVRGDALIPVGDISYSILEGSILTANYDVIKTEEGLLPVISKQPLKTYRSQGVVLTLPDAVRRQIIINLNTRGVEGNVLPIMLDSTGAPMQDARIKMLFASGLVCFTLYQIIRLILRYNYKRHPLYKSLLSYGMPEAVAESVEVELEEIKSIRENYRYLVTPTWIIKKGPFSCWLKKNYLEMKRNSYT